jgi:hypothetical protein
MREQLLAYLLDDLNPAERSTVEAALADNPELQQELEKLRECLGCCESPAEPEPPQVPPVQLASRTCHFVEHAIQKSKAMCGRSAHAKTLSESHDPLVRPTRWSPADIGVGICVLVALAALVFPMLKQDQETARLLACQNNLHQVGAALMDYSVRYNKGLPVVGEKDNAGIYVVILTESGTIERKELKGFLVCPSSETAERISRGCIDVVIPSSEELAQASPDERDRLRKFMAGDYAYTIGYLDKNTGRMRQVHFGGSRFIPLLADGPSPAIAGYQSANHGGCGQNVLYQDLSCKYTKQCKCKKRRDHLYLNDEGQVAAGCHPEDIVLAPSGATPLVNLTAGK